MTDTEVIKHILQINDINMLVSILELTCSCLEIDTISETARKEGKTPTGIKNSKRYYKTKIGKQTFAIKGKRDNDLPF